MPFYYIWTIGCQMNKADSEQITCYLEQAGHQVSYKAEEADIIVLNSCVVRQSAEDRVVNKLNTLRWCKKKGNPIIILTGCMVGPGLDDLRHRFPHIDLFLRPQAFSELARFLADRGLAPAEIEPEALLPRPSPSSFISIMHGCNSFCSYCVVPYRRGRERSRPIQQIVSQAQQLVERGMKQVVLLGQKIDAYGYDLSPQSDLAELLNELNRIDGLARIRFLTSHPGCMTDRIIEAMASLDRVCKHLSLPFQAGDDDILRAMRRGYTAADYRNLVTRIRRAIPNIAVSTDVIVGFPGESEEQFQRTVDLVCELRFDTVHVAAYSPRPGTIASRKLADDVPTAEKLRRQRVVEQLQESIATEINSGLLDTVVEVLVEGREKEKWWGRTGGDKLVFFEDKTARPGDLVNIRIERTTPWSLQGSMTDGPRDDGTLCQGRCGSLNAPAENALANQVSARRAHCRAGEL